MIEFIGMPSGELKKYIINYNKKIGLIGGIPGALIMLAVIIYYALKVHLVVLFGLVGPALWIILIVSQPFKKDVPKLCSTKLTIILEKGIMITHTNEQAYTRSISAVKRVLEALKNDTDKVQELLSVAYKLLDKSVSKGVLHKNTAARKKSRLTKFVNKTLAQ